MSMEPGSRYECTIPLRAVLATLGETWESTETVPADSPEASSVVESCTADPPRAATIWLGMPGPAMRTLAPDTAPMLWVPEALKANPTSPGVDAGSDSKVRLCVAASFCSWANRAEPGEKTLMYCATVGAT